MSIETDSCMTSRLFVGYSLHPELKLQLSQSPHWKEAKILRHNESEELLEIHYQAKDYIGRFLTKESLTLSELKQVEADIQSRLKKHCPLFPIDKLNIWVLTQVFIS